ncbi:MAG: hypothetical protein WC204_09080 [Elusimicrobiales bacterium]|jgi:hypothetical protein
MKIIIAALGFLLAGFPVFASENYNSVAIQGTLTSTDTISNVKVDVYANGSIVGSSDTVTLSPDTDGFFTVFLHNIDPSYFSSSNDQFEIVFSTGGFEIMRMPLTSVPFAKALKGPSSTDNLIAAKGNVGIGTTSPTHKLHVDGGGYFASSVTASSFHGDGSGLTDITVSGDNLGNHTATTILNMNNQQIVNVSTIVTSGTSIVLSANSYNYGNNDAYAVAIGSDVHDNHDWGVGIGWMAHSNYHGGVGVGAGAFLNYDGGVGAGNGTYHNYDSGVGVGSYAADNYTGGVGVGEFSGINYVYGTGLGAFAHHNHNYGIGIGYDATENYSYGIAIGAYALGNHDGGTSVGAYTTAQPFSVAFGYAAVAPNDHAVALGAGSQANAEESVALGAYTVNNATSSVKIKEGYVLFVDSISISGAQVLTFSTNVVVNGDLHATKFYGDGSGLTGISAAGDNLGNHTATQALNMAGNQILNVSSLTVTGKDSSGYSLSLSSGINMPGGTVNAGLFIGNGSGLTGLPSGGDVYKASTQTFTGQNTFANLVSISSHVALSQPSKIQFANGQYIKNDGGGGLEFYSGSSGQYYLLGNTVNISSNIVGSGNFTIPNSKQIIFDPTYTYIQGARSGADYLTVSKNAYASGIQLGFDTNAGFGPTMTIVPVAGTNNAGNVGIGTTSPAAKLEVDGFTMLGENSPHIKMIKLSSTTASAQDGVASFPHGYYPPNSLATSFGVEYSYFWNGTNIVVHNSPTNSSYILSKPIYIFITYEE